MYSNAAAVFRGDLTGGLVEQASSWERGLIGIKVCPVINVPTRAGQFPVFNLAKGNLLRNDVTQRAPGSKYTRVTRQFEQDTYATQEYGIEEAVDDTTAADVARYFDAEVLAAKLAMRKVALGHELRVKTLLQNTTTFPTTASDTAYTIGNIATFDIGLDVEKAMDRLAQKGEDPSDCVAVMSNQVFLRARASTKLQNRLRGIGVSSDALLNVSEEAVAEALGVKAVFVSKAYYDASLENEAFSSTAIWNNTYVWVGNVGAPGGYQNLFGGGAAFTLNWGEYGPPFSVTSYRDETVKSDIVRSAHHVSEKVVNSNAGTLIATQYS